MINSACMSSTADGPRGQGSGQCLRRGHQPSVSSDKNRSHESRRPSGSGKPIHQNDVISKGELQENLRYCSKILSSV